MPSDKQMKKVLVIGSGPIVIGQAAEFDYAGTQACLTLKAAGYEVILLNNNPATMMTDENVADHVYFEPLTVQTVEKIFQKEKPDSLLATVSGQTGLNLAFKLAEQGLLKKYHVQVLGTSINAIKQGEDREKFKHLMDHIKEPTPESALIHEIEEGISFSEQVGFPLIIRPAYTLGGSGGGIAKNAAQFKTMISRGLRASPIHQCLVEKSIAGWKEIEFEVIRDKNNVTVVICQMENFDPVGVHTGDSIVVSPIQTLTNREIQVLSQASKKIVQEIGIIGACNVQLAYDPETKSYAVIEVNPRVSRSSALASKATGYPIAKIATKLSIGYTLAELYDGRLGKSLAACEPKMDHVVVKFPCWPFNKLTSAERFLGTEMKATGEVMALEKTLAAAVQKSIRSIGVKLNGIRLRSLQSIDTATLKTIVQQVDDRRFFAIIELLQRGTTVTEINEMTTIDSYFLECLASLVLLEKNATATPFSQVSKTELLLLKQSGFTNEQLASIWHCSVEHLKTKLKSDGIFAQYEKVHAYTSSTNGPSSYYFATWDEAPRPVTRNDDHEKVLIIGSGPIHIGQGLEFDYCSVQGVKALQKYRMKAILMNNNPATVSTDYEIADKLYVDPITFEDVLNIIEHEQIEKVIIQFGGQTAINLVKKLEAAGVTLLGSSMDTIDKLEDRERFYHYLQSIDVAHIPGYTANSLEEMISQADKIGYPILVRPSYVIGGQGMKVIHSEEQLLDVTKTTGTVFPLLVDAFYPGKEVEVDVVTDGENIFIPAIFEHIEKAGVHSGDSIAVTPPISLAESMKQSIVSATEKIAQGMDFKGIFNIQFVIYQDTLYVLEVNPRASRTVPVLSKVSGVNLIELATSVLLGFPLKTTEKFGKEKEFYTVKAPIFSTSKLPGVDPKLSPEMASTGEIMAVASTLKASLTKSFFWNESLAMKMQRPENEVLIMSQDAQFLQVKDRFQSIGIHVKYREDFSQGGTAEEIEDWLKSKKALAIFCANEESNIRRRAIALNVLVLSEVETVLAFSMISHESLDIHSINALQKEVIYQ